MIFHLKSIYRWTLQSSLLAILNQVSIQVTGYTIVWTSVCTVRSNIYFEHVVTLDIIIVFGESTRHSFSRQHNDSCMISTNTDFVFCTNHPCRFYTTDFWLLDSKAFITVIKFGTQGGNHYFLSGSYIRSPTYNLHRFSVSQIDGSDMQMVGIRVFFASQYFTDHESFQTTLNGLHFFYTTCFQADWGQRCSRFIGCQIKVDILFQPVIRDIHIIKFLLFLKKFRKVNKIFRLT